MMKPKQTHPSNDLVLSVIANHIRLPIPLPPPCTKPTQKVQIELIYQVTSKAKNQHQGFWSQSYYAIIYQNFPYLCSLYKVPISTLAFPKKHCNQYSHNYISIFPILGQCVSRWQQMNSAQTSYEDSYGISQLLQREYQSVVAAALFFHPSSTSLYIYSLT